MLTCRHVRVRIVSYDTKARRQRHDDRPDPPTYQGLTEAYDFFNHRLFSGRLPRCLITMQRQRGAYGYFAGKRFGTRDGQEVTDEIALNPAHFRSRTTRESLSTLAHEMCHLNPDSPDGLGRQDRTSRKRWQNRQFLLSPVGSLRIRLLDPA